eukprot:7615722-Alexandrium_andersonii.AAC.1
MLSSLQAAPESSFMRQHKQCLNALNTTTCVFRQATPASSVLSTGGAALRAVGAGMCMMGISELRRFQAAKRVFGFVGRADTAAYSGWSLGHEFISARG